jgi:hypothetical protein
VNLEQGPPLEPGCWGCFKCQSRALPWLCHPPTRYLSQHSRYCALHSALSPHHTHTVGRGERHQQGSAACGAAAAAMARRQRLQSPTRHPLSFLHRTVAAVRLARRRLHRLEARVAALPRRVDLEARAPLDDVAPQPAARTRGRRVVCQCLCAEPTPARDTSAAAACTPSPPPLPSLCVLLHVTLCWRRRVGLLGGGALLVIIVARPAAARRRRRGRRDGRACCCCCCCCPAAAGRCRGPRHCRRGWLGRGAGAALDAAACAREE